MRTPPLFDPDIEPAEKGDELLSELATTFSPCVPRSAARTMRRWGLPESVRDDLVSTG